MNVNPVVGYKGGKRRLCARLRVMMPAARVMTYAEPFVGMGAYYLDLRAQGFKGMAFLADSNAAVADFWRMVHSPVDGIMLRNAMRALPPGENALDYQTALARPCADRHERVAQFLWLTNYAFGNEPPRYENNRWHGPGTKLTSSAKWGKTFPWDDCCARLQRVIDLCRGLSCIVGNDAFTLGIPPGCVTYADPPYAKHTQYGKGRNIENTLAADHTERIRLLGGKVPLLLSEGTDLRGVLPGWQADNASVVARVSHGSGAEGKRREWLYQSPLFVSWRNT